LREQDQVSVCTDVNSCAPGDGSVPYASLNYCAAWRKSLPELKIEELPQVEHRSILGNRVFFQILIQYVSQQTSKKLVKSSAPAPNEHVMDFLDDVAD
jgi:hypothetical protein